MIAEGLRREITQAVNEETPDGDMSLLLRSLTFMQTVDTALTQFEAYLRANADLDSDTALVHSTAAQTLASYMRPVAQFEDE